MQCAVPAAITPGPLFNDVGVPPAILPTAVAAGLAFAPEGERWVLREVKETVE